MSHFVKRALEIEYLFVNTGNIEVVSIGYHSNKCRIKIAVSLLVIKLKPTLNILKKLVPIKLFS